MYFKVVAKCGHVGKNKFIKKSFYVFAENGSEAAKKVRLFPRVKHNHKDAILSCESISSDEFNKGIINNNKDPYYSVTNKQDQIYLCDYLYENIELEQEKIIYPKKKNKFRLKNYKLKEYLSINIKEALKHE